jgi:hypothetical protein
MLAMLCAGVLGDSSALATVGGPTVCEVLGWDAGAKRIYVHEIPQHGGDAFGIVRSFDCAALGDPVLHDEAWSSEGAGAGTADDPELLRRLEALRSRLQPLKAETVALLPWQSEVIARDTLVVAGDPQPRERVRARLAYGLEVEVDTFGGIGVALAGAWPIPGRKERLVVLAFRGDPFEGGYEVQVPMIVHERESGVRRVTWGRER